MKRRNIILTENCPGNLLALLVLQAVNQHLSSSTVRMCDKKLFSLGMKEQRSPVLGGGNPNHPVREMSPSPGPPRASQEVISPRGMGTITHLCESAGDPVL